MAGPRIIYSLVSKRQTVLAEFAITTGNFQAITRKILEKIPKHNGKMSYSYDQMNFHYNVDDELVFLCMSDESFNRRLAFDFLDNIQQRFKSQYGEKPKATMPLQYNDDFSRTLQRQMEHYNSEKPDKVKQVKNEIEEVKSVLVQNIEKLVDRGEKIDLLVDKTEAMNQESIRFKKGSTKLKRSMWCKNFKLTLLLIMIVLAIGFVIFLFACSGFSCTKGSPSPPPEPHPPAPTPPTAPAIL